MSSSYARIAWGISFGDPVNTCEGSKILAYQFEGSMFPRLFGFTEEMPLCPDGLDHAARQQWWKTVRDPWTERLDAAVPLTFVHYGYENGGTVLVLKRSLTTSEWDAVPVDLATLAEPTPDELAAFAMVLEHLGIGGEVRLLLLSQYG